MNEVGYETHRNEVRNERYYIILVCECTAFLASGSDLTICETQLSYLDLLVTIKMGIFNKSFDPKF